MRWARVVVLAILAGVLQVSLMGALRIGMVVPSIVLVGLVAETIWGKASEALLFAVITGLIIDTASAGNFGLATSSLVLLTLMLVALYQLGLDGRVVFTRLGLVAGVTAVWGVLHVAALGLGTVLALAAWQIISVEVIVNMLLALPIGERVVRGARTV